MGACKHSMVANDDGSWCVYCSNDRLTRCLEVAEKGLGDICNITKSPCECVEDWFDMSIEDAESALAEIKKIKEE